MKKIIFKLLSITVVLMLSTTAFSYNKKADPPPNKTNSTITTYVVNVDDSYTQGVCMEYYVMVTLPCGSPVAPPQKYQEGVKNYIFEEIGSVQGLRFARLIKKYGQSPVNCTHQIHTQPSFENVNSSTNTLCALYLFPILISGND